MLYVTIATVYVICYVINFYFAYPECVKFYAECKNGVYQVARIPTPHKMTHFLSFFWPLLWISFICVTAALILKDFRDRNKKQVASLRLVSTENGYKVICKMVKEVRCEQN